MSFAATGQAVAWGNIARQYGSPKNTGGMFWQKIGSVFGKVVKGIGSFFGMGGEVRGTSGGVNIIIPPELYGRFTGPGASGPVQVTPRVDWQPIALIGVFGVLFILLIKTLFK